MILNATVEEHLKEVFNLEYLLECYELRIKLSRENQAEKTEFEKNETELLVFKTNHHIQTTQKLIKGRKQELADTLKIYFQELAELKEQENGDGSLFDYQ